jgi:hypothetical protein
VLKYLDLQLKAVAYELEVGKTTKQAFCSDFAAISEQKACFAA